MEDFREQLSKPEWWIGVVVVGIAINLVSAYLKRHLDGALSAASMAWRGMSKVREDAWRSRVDRVKSSPERLALEVERENRLRLKSLYLLVLSSSIYSHVLLLQATHADGREWMKIASLLLSTMLFFISFLLNQSATKAQRVISQARRELKQLGDHNQADAP